MPQQEMVAPGTAGDMMVARCGFVVQYPRAQPATAGGCSVGFRAVVRSLSQNIHQPLDLLRSQSLDERLQSFQGADDVHLAVRCRGRQRDIAIAHG